jgi:hypothetical protein
MAPGPTTIEGSPPSLLLCSAAVFDVLTRGSEQDTTIIIYLLMAVIGFLALTCVVCLLAAYLLYKRKYAHPVYVTANDDDDESIFAL